MSRRIKDGIKEKGGKVEIKDVGRRDLPRFFKDMGFKKGVEIGVQRGFFTRRLCAVGLKVFGVDPWKAYRDYCPMEQKKYQTKQDKIYEIAQENLSMYPDCELIRKTSMDALEDFEDESLDFVYIDGHHGFKYVTEDIYEWTKKVRKGGIISGHDYAYGAKKPLHAYTLQVKFVIDAYVKAFRIKDWWVLGAKHKTFSGERRDQYRSWMWFKE